MARANRGGIPAAPQKTLLEWIDNDDGDTPSLTRPSCNAPVQALHARIIATADDRGRSGEAIEPPRGLRLAPLG